MRSFTIERATIADIPKIIGIQEKTWEPTYRDILSREQITYMFDKIYSSAALESQMTEGGQVFLILYESNIPTGFGAFTKESTGTFKLHKIYVLPSSQGTGAGRYLLQAAENEVKLAGGCELLLNVNRFNPARTFYEKMGYEVIAEKDIPIGPYWMNDFILRKILCQD